MTAWPKIYKAGQTLNLVYDSDTGDEKGHTVTFPIDERGFSALVNVLAERERNPNRRVNIGEKGNPVQHMVDEWLKQGNAIKKPKETAAETLTLDDLEL